MTTELLLVNEEEQHKKIVVLCDGTWCGESTETITNIKILADRIAGTILINSDQSEEGNSHTGKKGKRYSFSNDGSVVGCYFEGIGLAGGFYDYIANGAMALDIKEACLDVYKYIVKNFELGDEIWMFGLSRGAYTVRCVAGMINNCGILKIGNKNIRDNIKEYCNEVYNIYRNKNNHFKPAIYKEKFIKKNLSHETNKPPIKFMGLLDTVGSLGIPKINPGQYLDYEEFYDQNVSGEVQNVYQALAIHDRLFAFEPCFIRRSKKSEDFSYNKGKDENNEGFIKYDTIECWFPGAHYDIGRQHFIFTRHGENPLENLFNVIIKLFGIGEIQPNETYAENVLEWMIEMIKIYSNNFNLNPLPPTTEQSLLNKLKDISDSILNREILKNDVYDKFKKMMYSIAIDPIGKIFVSILNQQALRDRYIPYKKAVFNDSEEVLRSISKTEYPSNTYETYETLKDLKPDYTEWIININELESDVSNIKSKIVNINSTLERDVSNINSNIALLLRLREMSVI